LIFHSIFKEQNSTKIMLPKIMQLMRPVLLLQAGKTPA
jgi:hypothetical protein